MTMGLKANADGSGAIQVGGSDAITITSGLNTTFAGTASVATGALYPLVSGTAVAASGTSVDFTGIPSTAKRITVMFSGVSTNGSSLPQIQLGDSGGIENTGYVSLISSYAGASTNNSTTGILVNVAGNAGYVVTGIVTIVTLGSNLWVASMVTNTDPSFGNFSSVGSARKTLSDTLDRVRITTVNGTDTFDAGTINILYE